MFALHWLARELIFPRRFLRQDPCGAQAVGLEKWWLETAQGAVEVWFLPAHAKALAALDPCAELVLYDCGHNDLPRQGSDYWPRIEALLRTAGVLR